MRASIVVMTMCLAMLLLTTPPPALADVDWEDHYVTEYFNGASRLDHADIDGDGDLDIVASGSAGDDVIWLENVDSFGTIWNPHAVDEDFVHAIGIVATDIDGDGDYDIVCAGIYEDKITLWKNDGTGTTWTAVVVAPNFGGAHQVSVGDADGDGDLDIFGVSRQNSQIAWWENTEGDATDWSVNHIDNGGYTGARNIVAADVDGDGDIDAVSATYPIQGNDPHGIDWWENTDGLGDFSNGATSITTGFTGARGLFVIDMDGDGDVDVFGSAEVTDQVCWWENDGDGDFTLADVIATGFDGASDIMVEDIDGDGDFDVVGAADGDDVFAWWENTDDVGTTWSEHVLAGTYDDATSVDAADFDGDGDIDLVGTARVEDIIKIWLQTDEINVLTTPHSPPIVVAPLDWFYYDLRISTNLTSTMTGCVWTDAKGPSGNYTSPKFHLDFTFWPGLQIYVQGIGVRVDATAPDGDYEWRFSVGDSGDHFAWTPIDSDSFAFTVEATEATSDQGSTGWSTNARERILAAFDNNPVVSEDRELPLRFWISPAYPNPFNPSTNLDVYLPETAELAVAVYNVAGQQVAELANGQFNAGQHNLTFDASNLASGLYFIRATVPGQLNATQKLMLVR
jgi:FG-GAP-like repeat/Secretion system C-terminal sorting domain